MNNVLTPFEISCWSEWRGRIKADPIDTLKKLSRFLAQWQAYQKSLLTMREADFAGKYCNCGAVIMQSGFCWSGHDNRPQSR